MKKLLSLMLGIAAMLASCSQNEELLSFPIVLIGQLIYISGGGEYDLAWRTVIIS